MADKNGQTGSATKTKEAIICLKNFEKSSE